MIPGSEFAIRVGFPEPGKSGRTGAPRFRQNGKGQPPLKPATLLFIPEKTH